MRRLPLQITRDVRIWWWSYMSWLVGFFVLGALAVVLPALIGFKFIKDPNAVQWIAVIATIVSALQTFLRCDSRAGRFHAAYRGLNSAKMRFENEAEYPVSKVIDAWEGGEQVIGSGFAPRRRDH